MVQGDIRNLDGALRDVMAQYKPGVNGLVGIDTCVITLPLESWSWYGWIEQANTASIGAGVATTVALFTVPENERAWIDAVTVARVSGDNLCAAVPIAAGPGYGSGNRGLYLTQLATPVSAIYWPHVGQTVTRGSGPTPLLLEAGGIVQFTTDGTGVSASVFSFTVSLRRTKIRRILVP